MPIISPGVGFLLLNSARSTVAESYMVMRWLLLGSSTTQTQHGP